MRVAKWLKDGPYLVSYLVLVLSLSSVFTAHVPSTTALRPKGQSQGTMEQVYKAVIIPKRSATLTQEEPQTTETMLNMLKTSLILSQKLLSKSPHRQKSRSLCSLL